MKVLIIDGHGGQMGATLVKEISARFPQVAIMAVGTNAVATASMMKAGAKQGATGENPVVVACRTADVIIGPVGIVIADSLYGEITPKMAISVGQAKATRILLPLNRCDNLIAGINDLSMNVLIGDVISKLSALIK